jgi:hypothetical protein
MSDHERNWETKADYEHLPEEDTPITPERGEVVPAQESASPAERDVPHANEPIAEESGQNPEVEGEHTSNVVPFARSITPEADSVESMVHELEAQGFTTDEALGLIHVSENLSSSREARDAEATLRRLRFTRWLIAHGILDEFSA